MRPYEFRKIDGRDIGRRAVGPWYQYIEIVERMEVVDVKGSSPTSGARKVTAWSHDETRYADQLRLLLSGRRFGSYSLDGQNPGAIETELSRLSREYPVLADALRATFPPPPATPAAPGLFPLGARVRFELSLTELLPPGCSIGGFVARHAAGDLGHGNLADVELNEDMRWCPHIFGSAVQAAVAIERGAGFVCSVYAVKVPQSRIASVSVATYLDPSAPPVTVFWTGSPNMLP